ncbi:hypothetical protein E3N88_33451 [Mikania micrantha]|uniref:Gnk2-homologous domain-containing protein n=1 Tax=Mikania micrantha TaxID=192012 RepID=A0A5N6MBJ5_9ASTR|nr:hypothetical protein E3N88_33451 [Mikania micrantha]
MQKSSHGQCSNPNTTFQKNWGKLLDLLTKNTPLHDGFYNSSVGNGSDQVYGVSQCKANISSTDCSNCLKSSIGSSNGCTESTGMESVSSLCTTKINSKNVIGVWTNFSTARFGNQGLDNPLVFSKGFLMMQELATTVPNQPFMYQEAEIDVGVDGERFGLAQCGRDLSKLDCQNCLEDRLVRYRSYVMNRSGWEILGSSCSLWYSNVSDANMHRDVNVTALTPSTSVSDGRFPYGTPSVISGAQRCLGEFRTGNNIRISSFTIFLLATRVFQRF